MRICGGVERINDTEKDREIISGKKVGGVDGVFGGSLLFQRRISEALLR